MTSKFWKNIEELAAMRDKIPAERKYLFTCAICKNPWNDPPGTVYCGSQHGLCELCKKPRTLGSCKCFTSTTENTK